MQHMDLKNYQITNILSYIEPVAGVGAGAVAVAVPN